MPAFFHSKDPLQNAVAFHQAGEILQAQHLYQAILATSPLDADALHLLGVTFFQQGSLDQALKLIGESLEINPHNCLAYTNIGNVFQRLQRHQDAINCYDCALTIDPAHADAFFNRGIALQSVHRNPEALTSFENAITLNPDNAEAYNLRGNILQSQGREQAALESYDEALNADHNCVDAHFNRGNSLYALGQFENALSSFDDALLLRPAFAAAHNNRGNLLHTLQRDGEAVASYDVAIALDPDYAQAFFNRGVALQFMDRNLEASASYADAIKIKPDYAEAFNNQGNVFQNMNLYQNALNAYHQAQTIDPEYGDAHWNEALCRLKTGDFENGWEKYEWRWQNSISNPSKQQFIHPLWQGKENLDGKTILLHSEQGLGDTIQFFRYAAMVSKLGAKTLLQVHPSLAVLLRNRLRGVKILSRAATEEYDFHCPLLSLPLAFNTKLWAIPASPSYLFSDPAISTLWQNKIGLKNYPRVGLVWSGNKQNANDHQRSAALLEFAKLFRHDIQWFSLQKEISNDEDSWLKMHGVNHYGNQLNSFSETAALIEQMDLVISVDTAVAHLAAAMGKPTWVLLAHNADFRWLLGRSDSPWYPSVQLFRQPEIGDWSTVFARLIQHMRFLFGVQSKAI
jgi:tetratricopeptide (TPR) repeat protein